MRLNYDGQIDIATAAGIKSTKWTNNKLQWSEIATRLSEAVNTGETYKEFIQSTKEEQTKIKDVGGFVGGYLREGKRSPSHVVSRQLIALDIDFAHGSFWDDFTLFYSNAAVLHGTHKNCKDNPRFRLLMPLSRKVTPDEYVAISRKVAGSLGIDLFDNTTFETNRLMFWSSVPKDIEFYFKVQDGDWLDADAVLAEYDDWTDTSLWPVSDRSLSAVKGAAEKQKDPETKRGVVGAFCRTYTIQEAIELLLPDDYEALNDGRYTYKGGSTAGGLVIYQDKFAYSHHGTDPAGGKLCNAFDLVRLHKFGHLDLDDASRLSYAEMQEFALADKEVKKTFAKDKVDNAKFAFAKELELGEGDDELEADLAVTLEDTEWMVDLESDKNGDYKSSAGNINLILAKDERLKGIFKQNDFDSKRYVHGSLPWRRIDGASVLRNVDLSGIRNYIETVYGVSASFKVEDSLALEFERNTYHPIRDYLKTLKWDGEPRLHSVLSRYFGAPDTAYTREAFIKSAVGAVARVFNPGVKFDLMLVLVGAQGTGKSTFVKKLAGDWFSDTVTTVSGREGLEQIQGAWLIEIAELAAMRKADIEGIKHFISKQEDSFRAAYAKVPETYYRQCVFFGTTNTKEFLRDPTGNRRFMPIAVDGARVTSSVFNDLDGERDQLWAEAMTLYKAGEDLYLSPEAERIANRERATHSEVDDRTGIIEKYLERLLPTDWADRDLYSRRLYLEDEEQAGSVERQSVCVAEVWCECLGKNKEDMDRYKTRELNEILRSIDGWDSISSTKSFGIYGKQKYYTRSLL